MTDDGEPGLIVLSPVEARTLAAVHDQMFPADDSGPAASEIGAHVYVDRALAGPYRELLSAYRVGLADLNGAALARYGLIFAECPADNQDTLLQDLEAGSLGCPDVSDEAEFFSMLRAHLQEGLFADPAHGGNRRLQGWRFLRHPGIWFENSALENLSQEPATKDGVIHCLEDVRSLLRASPEGKAPSPHPVRTQAAGGDPDVILVGVGAMGSLAARILTASGLRVLGLEAGPWRENQDYVPDELSSAYYCRGAMGQKFLDETPSWRRRSEEPTRPAAFSLGRMMNGVGGSVVHWGGAVRRFHPHHFGYLTHVREAFGEGALPEAHTLLDWPIGYDDLEPYYIELERMIGVAGDGRCNPYVPRSQPLPLPPVRPFTGGELFQSAAQRMGLHPYPTPVAVNSRPYNGGPESSYCAWMGGFGPFRNDRWHPAMTWIPEAMQSGHFDLRTGCRVLRVLTDSGGHTSGVEYADAEGNLRTANARAVILASYTFENVRLLLLSGDARHPNGLGNNAGQVGKHFMVKIWDDVHGSFPDTVFNAHTGPSAQMWSLDDFVADSFDTASHGFVGGGTPNVENQQLPIQISREQLPPDVRSWGAEYKRHLTQWQHNYAIRLQLESLPYEGHALDLDPIRRDCSGFGLPLIRVTYDTRQNEDRLADWMEIKAEEILREMGAQRTWRGPRSCRVCSSHDLGGIRMGEDHSTSVVDPDLRVHDTPGLYVYGGAVFPTCPGINPTLTMWAVCFRAAERLATLLRSPQSC